MATSFEVTTIPVTHLKRGRKVDAGKLLRVQRDSIERAEFEPDNSRIGRESYGAQTGKLATDALYAHDWSRAASLMIFEHQELGKFGCAPMRYVVSLSILY
jgi:protein required for attachment to host cells